ncbi:Ubiquitin conjugating enzyme E2 [Spraguea lophii 42_110]|uniref:Ubiquitin conjugating enzyme E2 n=1 Tax=Spraguea lophii (strain 42_110) TaxID=1358809 RepID=S7XQ11_SPRLO|nr:Ubiquitin conjugating enzyme E2 [Spraguea lophii 42_110]
MNLADTRTNIEIKNLDFTMHSKIEKIYTSDKKYPIIIKFTIDIRDGIYNGREFVFHLKIPIEYPFKPPKLICMTPIFHPNIDSEGNVCLEIIREKWTCALGIQNIIVSAVTLFFEFNGDNALNIEAGDMFVSNYDEFVKKAQNTK